MKSDGLSYAMVVAHPDDDAYGAAGAVALHADDPGFRFILIHATDGGSGDIRPGSPATRESLGRIRMQEDEDGWRAVGRSPDRHEWLGFPDGELDQVPLAQLTDAIDVSHARSFDDEIGLTMDCRPDRRRLAAAQEPTPRHVRRSRRHGALEAGEQQVLGSGRLAAAQASHTDAD